MFAISQIVKNSELTKQNDPFFLSSFTAIPQIVSNRYNLTCFGMQNMYTFTVSLRIICVRMGEVGRQYRNFFRPRKIFGNFKILRIFFRYSLWARVSLSNAIKFVGGFRKEASTSLTLICVKKEPLRTNEDS